MNAELIPSQKKSQADEAAAEQQKRAGLGEGAGVLREAQDGRARLTGGPGGEMGGTASGRGVPV